MHVELPLERVLVRLNVATVEYQGMKWHPAFTSKQRISDYVKEPETCLGAVAKNLFALERIEPCEEVFATD